MSPDCECSDQLLELFSAHPHHNGPPQHCQLSISLVSKWLCWVVFSPPQNSKMGFFPCLHPQLESES